jgi:hypothetical protein
MEAILAAAVSSCIALVGTIITVRTSQRKTQASVESTMKTEMAVMSTKLENLTKEVEKHNNFAERIPRVEGDLDALKETVQTLQSFHLRA